MTREEIKKWWDDLFGAKFKNSTTYRAVEEKLDQIYNAHETEIEELRSAIDMLVEEAAMYRNALNRNKEAHKTELKAKEEKHGDELQALLNDMGRAISKLSGELKAKDEQIAELNAGAKNSAEIYAKQLAAKDKKIVELEAIVKKVYRYADNEICKEGARCFTSSRMEALKEIRAIIKDNE